MAHPALEVAEKFHKTDADNIKLCLRILEDRATKSTLVVISDKMARELAGFLRRLQLVP